MSSVRKLIGLVVCLLLAGVTFAQNLTVTVDAQGLVRVPKTGFDPDQARKQGQMTGVDSQGAPVIFDTSQGPQSFDGETYAYARATAPAAAPASQAAGAPATTAEAAPAPPKTEGPAVGITEAAGTLTNPTAFLYLSKEFVFNLLVLANALGIPGVGFDSNRLPVSAAPSQARMRSGGGVETAYLGEPSGASRQSVSAARYMAGMEEGAGAAGAAAARPATQEDRSQWLRAVSVSGNEDLSKLLDLVKDLPTWQRVGRFPLLTTEKQRIDKAISDVYTQAFQRIGPQQQYQYQYQQYGSPYAPTPSPWTTAGPGAPPPGSNEGGVAPPGTAPGGVPQGPPPIDPQAMGEWYYFYQQVLAWERYVGDEVLLLDAQAKDNRYELDTALGAQQLYLVPQPANGPPPIVHFDSLEGPVVEFMSTVVPSAVETAVDQMHRSMGETATKRAKEDSDRSREFVARLNARKERRFRYREWLNDRTTEIRQMARDYQRRMSGEQFEIDGTLFLVSAKPLDYIPLGARNIVTEMLTPYDLLDEDGTLKKPTEKIVEQTP